MPPRKPGPPLALPAPLRKNLWDRYAAEGDDEYRAFLDYLESGRPRRVMALAGAYTTAALAEWSKKFRWPERARAWDTHIQAIELHELEKAAEIVGRTRAQVYLAIAGKLTDTFELETAKLFRDARSSTHTTMRPNELARLLEVAQKVEHLASGKPTGILQSDLDLSRLSPEALLKIEEILEDASAREEDDPAPH